MPRRMGFLCGGGCVGADFMYIFFHIGGLRDDFIMCSVCLCSFYNETHGVHFSARVPPKSFVTNK